MISIKSSGTFTGAGVLTAIAASLCCITPVIALLAGGSSVAANFSWIEPARPYLIGLSIAVLTFAWYLKLKPTKTNDDDFPTLCKNVLSKTKRTDNNSCSGG